MIAYYILVSIIYRYIYLHDLLVMIPVVTLKTPEELVLLLCQNVLGLQSLLSFFLRASVDTWVFKTHHTNRRNCVILGADCHIMTYEYHSAHRTLPLWLSSNFSGQYGLGRRWARHGATALQHRPTKWRKASLAWQQHTTCSLRVVLQILML